MREGLDGTCAPCLKTFWLFWVISSPVLISLKDAAPFEALLGLHAMVPQQRADMDGRMPVNVQWTESIP